MRCFYPVFLLPVCFYIFLDYDWNDIALPVWVILHSLIICLRRGWIENLMRTWYFGCDNLTLSHIKPLSFFMTVIRRLLNLTYGIVVFLFCLTLFCFFLILIILNVLLKIAIMFHFLVVDLDWVFGEWGKISTTVTKPKK